MRLQTQWEEEARKKMFVFKYLRINSDPTLNNQLEWLIRRVSKTGRSLLTDNGEVTTEVTRLTVYPSQPLTWHTNNHLLNLQNTQEFGAQQRNYRR